MMGQLSDNLKESDNRITNDEAVVG